MKQIPFPQKTQPPKKAPTHSFNSNPSKLVPEFQQLRTPHYKDKWTLLVSLHLDLLKCTATEVAWDCRCQVKSLPTTQTTTWW